MRCVTAWLGLADVRVTYPVASPATSCGSGSSFGRASTRSPAANTPMGSPFSGARGRGPGAWQGRQPPRRGVTGPPAPPREAREPRGSPRGVRPLAKQGPAAAPVEHQTPATRENVFSEGTRRRPRQGRRGEGQEAGDRT